MNKKTLLLAAAACVTVVSLVTGATFALFTSSATESNNTFQSGQLCFTAKRDNSDPVPGPMFYVSATPVQPGDVPGNQPTGVWAPGDSHTKTLIMDNPCLGVWLDSVRAVPQSGDVALANSLNVTITTAEPGQVNDQVVGQGTLAQFLAGNIPLTYPVPCSPAALCGGTAKRVPLPNSALLFLHFKVDFDITAGNSLQGKDLMVRFVVNGSQQANNP